MHHTKRLKRLPSQISQFQFNDNSITANGPCHTEPVIAFGFPVSSWGLPLRARSPK
uniref:Uncharacterized protein n=2 Tax=Anguilla anguilla TaxID=7936 RepID=A0A0E9TTA8_ANGAN